MYELYVFPMIAHFKTYLNLPSITLNMTSYCSVICLPRYVDIYVDYSVDMCRAWYVYSDDMSTYMSTYVDIYVDICRHMTVILEEVFG